MDSFRMRFVVGNLSEDELLALKNGDPVISKMLLVPDDYRVFHYRQGDDIEAETLQGNRVWTTIRNIEALEDAEHVIVILTLTLRPSEKNPL